MTEILLMEFILVVLYMIFLLTVVLYFDILEQDKGDGVRQKSPGLAGLMTPTLTNHRAGFLC
jgi:hypothetical protein